MLKIPSLKTLTYGLQQVVQRFPMVVMAASLKALILLFLIESSEARPSYLLAIRLVMVVFLALPLLLSLHLVAERRRWTPLLKLSGLGGILLALLLYYLTLEAEPIQRDYYRFGMFMACVHLLVSFAPFVGYDEPNGFWQFNKVMLIQLVTATLYAGTLFLGLVVAIETVRFLFDVTYPFKIEADLLVLTLSFFHTLFFLNGFPLHLDILNGQNSQSRGVKVFTQYVLLPLVVVYLAILYVYIGKIIVQWQLPEGGVAYLVMAFSVAGILALLLIYPMRNLPDERWIRLFTRRFHLALFPLIVLLFVAIYRRINDYGITENRYLVAALAIWLAGISFYFLFGKKEDIRWIPLSLCIVSFLLAVGPWSIFSVSRRDQARRFEALLSEYGLLGSNQTISGKATLPTANYDRLVSEIRYFRDRREMAPLRPYFASLPTSQDHFVVANAMEKQLQNAIEVKASPSAGTPSSNSLTFALSKNEQEAILDVKGFDRMVMLDMYGDKRIAQGNWRIEASGKGAHLSVFRNSDRLITWDIAPRLLELEARYGSSYYELSPDLLTFEHPEVRLIIQNVSKSGSDYTYQGILLWKER